MKNNEIYIKDICTGFRNLKGKASAYCFPPFKVEEVLYNLIYLYRGKRPNSQILIVVDTFVSRLKIVEYFRSGNIDLTDIKILSYDYIKLSQTYINNFIILVNVFDFTIINKLTLSSQFTFAIFTKNIMDNNFIINVRNILPEIKVSVTNTSAIIDKVNSPIEEYRIGVELNDTDRLEYDKCNKFIRESLQVFGTLENADKCRIGDVQNGISAATFREELAFKNGWNFNLDTSFEFNKQLDEIYNPNSLYERANLIYNVTRHRAVLISDCQSKLEAIRNIIINNLNKKILIISKRGEFANAIYKYLNENELYCGVYHDEIESQYVADENGDIICYKSGEKKGQPKPFAATSLSNLFLDKLNNNEINILSVKNNLNTKIETYFDIIIFTAISCLTIEEFIYKYPKIDLSSPIVTYRLYCNNTIEYTKLNSIPTKSNITIIEDEKNIEISDESGDIIL